MTLKRTNILGVGVSVVDVRTATEAAMMWLNQHARTYVTVTSVHGLIEAQDDRTFKAILNESGMTVPDGMPLVWLTRWAGRADVSRVCGTDFMLSLSKAMAAAGKSAFYYGGVEGVADRLAETLEKRFPGLKTAGTYSPPFRDLTAEEESAVGEQINASSADVIWIGLSTPKQERWMVRFRPRLHAPLLVGVGAVFDFLTGRVKRAPNWVQQSGFEWLHRLLQEPRRLAPRYLRNNPRFLYLVACEKLRLRDFNE